MLAKKTRKYESISKILKEMGNAKKSDEIMMIFFYNLTKSSNAVLF